MKNEMISRFAGGVRLFLIMTIFGVLSVHAAGEVDPSFLANLTNAAVTSVGVRVLRQPDGKILVSGNIPNLNGLVINNIVRLDANGGLDLAFNAPDFHSVPVDIALQSNGKILVKGNFLAVDSEQRSTLVRLNSDGSLDQTFPQLFPSNQTSEISKIFVYSDDSFLISGQFTINSPGGTRSNLARINADGSVNTSFNYAGGRVPRLIVQPDGKIVAGWVFRDGQIDFVNVSRFNSDGSPDPSFAQISVQPNSTISAMEYLPDGKIMIGGNFNFVNNVARVALFRANPDGTVDTSFPNIIQQDGAVYTIKPETSGKYYVSGPYRLISGTFSTSLNRLNSDGTLDTSFSLFRTYSIVNDIYIQPDGKLIILGSGVDNPILRINPNGGQDTTFTPPNTNSAGKALAVLVQPDNKILVGGPFLNANGFIRASFTRFNADGTLDTGFLPSGFGFSEIYDIALQPNNRILIAGTFGNAQRLNSTGMNDVTFPGTLYYGAIKPLPDGKVLIGGPTLRRHKSDGNLDVTLATLTGSIYKMVLQPDGKIIIVGNFTVVNGVSRNRIARLNADGSVDTSFNPPNGGANADIFAVAQQTDGKILIGGVFTSVNSDASRRYLARLNSDGTLDTSFSSDLNAPVLSLKIQSDGRILLGGSMSAVNGASRNRIARINANGTLDPTFNPGTGANSTVWSIDQQTDGKIVYVGEFNRTNNLPTLGIGRLLNASAPARKLFDYDGDGKADVSVFRASENKWYILQSSNFALIQTVFAVAGDIAAPGDFDGDGKTDVAIFRPSTGQWWYQSSINNAQVSVGWGQAGDIPRPADFDGDGKTDFIVYRPSNSVWYRYGSTGVTSILAFGIAEDKPLVGDFDGDGKADQAIFRPSTGDWWYAASSAGGQFRTSHWGAAGDIPVPADYDGDGKTDFAVYRPSNGGWYILSSSTGGVIAQGFGLAEDKPIAADYDGDGKADIAVFRPSTGTWYLLQTTAGFGAVQFGSANDLPTESAFIP